MSVDLPNNSNRKQRLGGLQLIWVLERVIRGNIAVTTGHTASLPKKHCMQLWHINCLNCLRSIRKYAQNMHKISKKTTINQANICHNPKQKGPPWLKNGPIKLPPWVDAVSVIQGSPQASIASIKASGTAGASSPSVSRSNKQQWPKPSAKSDQELAWSAYLQYAKDAKTVEA